MGAHDPPARGAAFARLGLVMVDRPSGHEAMQAFVEAALAAAPAYVRSERQWPTEQQRIIYVQALARDSGRGTEILSRLIAIDPVTQAAWDRLDLVEQLEFESTVGRPRLRAARWLSARLVLRDLRRRVRRPPA